MAASQSERATSSIASAKHATVSHGTPDAQPTPGDHYDDTRDQIGEPPQSVGDYPEYYEVIYRRETERDIPASRILQQAQD